MSKFNIQVELQGKLVAMQVSGKYPDRLRGVGELYRFGRLTILSSYCPALYNKCIYMPGKAIFADDDIVIIGFSTELVASRYYNKLIRALVAWSNGGKNDKRTRRR